MIPSGRGGCRGAYVISWNEGARATTTTGAWVVAHEARLEMCAYSISLESKRIGVSSAATLSCVLTYDAFRMRLR